MSKQLGIKRFLRIRSTCEVGKPVVGGMALYGLAMAVPDRAEAVPSIIPLIPFIGVLIAKIFMVAGASFFFFLSSLKKHRKVFFGLGVCLILTFLVLILVY